MREVSRRLFLPSLGALAALAALVVPKPTAALAVVPAQPSDHVLLALYDEWRACADDCDRLYRLQDEAEDRMHYPEPPEALFRVSADCLFFAGFVGHQHHTGRLWYGAPSSIEELKSLSCEAFDGHRRWIDRSRQARRDQIVAAYDGWQAVIEDNAAACGLAAASREADAACDRNCELRRRIVETPALTLSGILAKLLVAKWCNPEIVELAATRLLESGPTDETLVFAAMGDLVEVVDATYGGRAAA